MIHEPSQQTLLRCTTEQRTLRVSFTGPITETFEADSELAGLEQLLTPGVRIVLDLAQVSRINSAGVRSWITFLTTLQDNHTVVLGLISEPFVELAAISPFILGKLPAVVERFQIPYRCVACEHVYHVIGSVSNAGAGGTWKLPEKETCPNCRGNAHFDAVEREYFSFLKLLETDSGTSFL